MSPWSIRARRDPRTTRHSRSLEVVAIQAILSAAHTGEGGEGKIFVTPVERVIRICTDEEDAAAVTPNTQQETTASAAVVSAA